MFANILTKLDTKHCDSNKLMNWFQNALTQV